MGKSEVEKARENLEKQQKKVTGLETSIEDAEQQLKEQQEALAELEAQKRQYEEAKAKFEEMKAQGGLKDTTKIDEMASLENEIKSFVGIDDYEILHENGSRAVKEWESTLTDYRTELDKMKEEYPTLTYKDKENGGVETDSQAAEKPSDEKTQPKVSGIDYANDSHFTAPKQDTPEADSGVAKKPAGKTLGSIDDNTKWKNMTEHYKGQVQPVPEVSSNVAAKPGKSLAPITLEQAAVNSQKMTGNLLAENDPQYEGLDEVTEAPEVDSEAAAKAEEERINGLVKAVMHGDYGNGDDRKEALGADYDAVQAGVNAEYEKAKQRAAMVEAPEETGAVQAAMELDG